MHQWAHGLPSAPTASKTSSVSAPHIQSSIVAETANPGRSVASRRACQTAPVTLDIPPLKMTTVDPEPFGEPSLLSASSLLSDVDNTTTFTPNGLLDTGLFDGTGDSSEGGNASSAQSLSWVSRTSEVGVTDDDGSSTFMSNGLLDAPTQTTSTVICSDHLYGICNSPAAPRVQVGHPQRSWTCWGATSQIRKPWLGLHSPTRLVCCPMRVTPDLRFEQRRLKENLSSLGRGYCLIERRRYFSITSVRAPKARLTVCCTRERPLRAKSRTS